MSGVVDRLPAQAWHRFLLLASVALISLAAWLTLWQFGGVLHAPVHFHHGSPGAGFAVLFVGAWTIMTVAMMLPTTVPLLATFHTIAAERPNRSLLVALAIVGYLAVWSLVGVIVYAGGILAQQLAARTSWLAAHSTMGGALLITAGAYQFTSLKYRCLDKCRSPLSFVLGYWQGRHDYRNAWWMGAHHGLFCVGCCWALMLLMFAVGLGNLAWMLLLAAVMAVEKNVSWGRRISAPLGAILVACGLTVLAVS